MSLNHRREGRGRESQGNEGKRVGREDGSKAGGAVASPVRCQDVEPGKSVRIRSENRHQGQSQASDHPASLL